MYYGGGPPIRGQLHSAIDTDEDETLGKVYDRRVLARLPKYLAPVKGWLTLGAIGMIARTVAQLAIPYIVVVATDRFIQNGNVNIWPPCTFRRLANRYSLEYAPRCLSTCNVSH